MATSHSFTGTSDFTWLWHEESEAQMMGNHVKQRGLNSIKDRGAELEAHRFLLSSSPASPGLLSAVCSDDNLGTQWADGTAPAVLANASLGLLLFEKYSTEQHACSAESH